MVRVAEYVRDQLRRRGTEQRNVTEKEQVINAYNSLSRLVGNTTNLLAMTDFVLGH